MTVLLDANLLIALLVEDHVHHDAAEVWLAGRRDHFATCPITQGSLVRLLLRQGQAASVAHALLASVADDVRHDFWPDEISYLDVAFDGVIGHRQVTDAYLAELARARRGRLASFDEGLAALRPEVVDLVPTRMRRTSGH
ncbi:MAG: PIN domain-containing protein [Acidimicrobiales bacterium]|nr:PIN domain-containing protein [Acidimicrobiales bacterium]MBO0892867.1 PIN domain-containing protein [Acidimicrobiales bacterium]